MTSQEQKPAAFSVKDFCIWANISHSQFHKLVRNGTLKAHKIGRKTIVKRTDAEAWLNSLPSAA